MRSKFGRKYKVLKVLIVLIAFILFIYSFFYLMNNTKSKEYIINEYLSKLNNDNKFSISKTKLVYSSLNKIIDYDDIDIKLDDIMESPIVEKEEKIVLNPQVYIYNSHQTEEYFMPYISVDSIKPTVLFASYIFKDYLSDINIPSIVENKSMKKYLVENNLQYKDSYEASRYYLLEVLKDNSDIKYLIDIHRDSSKIDKTLYKKNNVEYARVMFVVGLNHKESSTNLEFAQKLNEILNDKYKGISRGIYERKDARFNQDLSKNAMLIEVGGVDNTIDQVNNTCKVLAEMLNTYIKENK